MVDADGEVGAGEYEKEKHKTKIKERHTRGHMWVLLSDLQNLKFTEFTVCICLHVILYLTLYSTKIDGNNMLSCSDK